MNKNEFIEDAVLTRTDCSRLLKVTPNHFDKLRKIPGFAFPKPLVISGSAVLRFSKQQVFDWIEACQKPTEKPDPSTLSKQINLSLKGK